MQRRRSKLMLLFGFPSSRSLRCAALRVALAATPEAPPRRVPSKTWPADSLVFAGRAGGYGWMCPTRRG